MKRAPADASASAGASRSNRRYSYPVDLGQRIYRLRLARGLTQRDLAGDRYTAAYVSSVESGRRSPSGDALRYFASRLGVTEDELVTGRSADVATALELAFTTALAEGTGFAEVAAEAAELGEGRWRAWALLELDPVGHLEEAGKLLEGEPPLNRMPLVLAQAAAAEPRYAVYLLEQARDALLSQGYPDPDACYALQALLTARYLELGDESRAAVAATEALRLTGLSDGTGYLQTARSLLANRRPGEATVAMGQARAAFRRAALMPALAACYRARAWQRRDAGDLEAAAADLSRARELYGDSSTGLDTAVELAEVQRRLGSASAAAALLDLVLREGSTLDPLPLRVAHARRESGLLAIESGDEEEAERHLRAAIALYWPLGPRRELARTLAVLGNLLNSQGRNAEAAAVLHDGLLRLEDLIRG